MRFITAALRAGYKPEQRSSRVDMLSERTTDLGVTIVLHYTNSCVRSETLASMIHDSDSSNEEKNRGDADKVEIKYRRKINFINLY